MGWGTIFDSARTADNLPKHDYIELHFKDATPAGMSMNDQLKQGNVPLGEWMLSYTGTLEEWKQLVERNHKKRMDKLKESLSR